MKNHMVAVVAKVLWRHWPVMVCRLLMRGRCAWACHLGPMTFDLDLGNLVAAAVSAALVSLGM